MFDAIFNAIAGLLSYFYSVAPSYAAAIALLTATVMLLCFPLTAKATRSMAKMMKLQPELRRIQQQHKNDRQKQTEETTALFREHGVSPFGGCLPIIVQGPVFLIMYRVLFGLTRRAEDGTFRPSYLSKSSELYRDLSASKTMESFGVDLAETASNVVRSSVTRSLPFLVLLGGVVATGYYQQRQITRRQPPRDPANENPYAQTMQRMTKIYPLLYLVMGFTLPAGINVYFLVSNLFRIAQQAVIYRLDPTLAPLPEQPAGKRGSSGRGGSTRAVGAKTVEPQAKGKAGDGGGEQSAKAKAKDSKSPSGDGAGGKTAGGKGAGGKTAGGGKAMNGGKPAAKSRSGPGSNGKARGAGGAGGGSGGRRPPKKRRGR